MNRSFTLQMHRICIPFVREVRVEVDASIALTGNVRGVAHQPPTLAEMIVLDDDFDPDESLAARAEHNAEKMDKVELREGVRVLKGSMVYEVVPERGTNGAVLAYYAEMVRSGHPSFRDDARLDRATLAAASLAFLESGALGGFIETSDRRRRRARPDDGTLLRYVREAFATEGTSPRRLLSEVFDVSVKTADDWVKYARSLPSATDLPAPQRGRPRKTTGRDD